MKSVLKILTPVLFMGFFLPVLAFAQSPSLPHQFFGSVNYTNGAAPNGLAVEARINGSVVGRSVTAGGNYGYNPNLLFALDNNGVHAGKTVEFYVGGVKANTSPETVVFANGNSSQVNLTIPASLPTTGGGEDSTSGGSTSTSGGSTTSSGAGGAGGAVTTTTTVTTTLSAAAQKVDANKDNKIDVLDFNTLMVNWGKTTANNIADFNGDSKVDIFDFNMLMINWTK